MRKSKRTHSQCADGVFVPVNKTVSLTDVKGASEATKSNLLTHVQR